MQKSKFIILLTVFCFSLACKDTNSSESEGVENQSEVNDQPVENEAAVPASAQTTLYTWVDNLRLRNEPNSSSKVMAEMKEGAPLIFMNEKSDFTQKVNLRGTIFDEPWLKVKTEKGIEGWVFGGGVRPYKTPTDQAPSPYDQCYKYLHDNRFEKYTSCTKEIQAKQLKKDLRYVEKIENGLRFRLLGGNELELNSGASEMDPANEAIVMAPNYSYRYYIPKMGYFVVSVAYDEGGKYILVNDKSGKQIEIWGYPKPSPDYKHLLVTSTDLEGAGGRANGVQVLSFTEDGLEVIYEKEMQDLEPILPKWIDDKTIELTLVSPTSASSKIKKLATLTISAEGEWALSD